MADQESCKDIRLLKRTKISVYVDEALPDILVVTFQLGLKIFKGALLDSTKKSIPCGIPNINPAFNTSTKSKPDDDTLYSVNQRFAYTDPANAKKKNVHISTKYKKSKMTVRLRPRQVLCTKCKGICNENSENVTRKRKATETMHTPHIKRSANAPVTRSVVNTINKKKVVVKRTLIPKAPQELPNALSGNVNKININNNKKPLGTVSNLKACTAATNTCDNSLKNSTDSSLGHSLKHSDSSNGSITDSKLKKILRKTKRSVGSLEDIWDEAASEDTNKNNNLAMQNNANNIEQPLSSSCTNTRTIKICYGPQGEGTVLKIPAQIENLNLDDDLEENMNMEDKDNQKAARKAMKKAKKEAKRKIVYSGSSPDQTTRFTVGGSSPRYTVGSASPRHGLGNNSPRYVATTIDPITPKKRKHKMKHKKKHREDKDRKHKDGEDNALQEELHKETCLTQKLSINLKRLSTSYLASQGVIEKSEESSSDEHDHVPVFPTPDSALLAYVNAPTLNTAPGAEGVPLIIGDVVWGNLQDGNPWWPGKVLTISDCDTFGPHALIAWYGSTKSSLINCDNLSPYLDNFKIRYCKRKRGPYKDAIKQATVEARTHAEEKLNIESVVASPKRSVISVVPPALASPREINVIS